MGIETLKTNNKQGFLNRNQTTYEAGNYDCFPAFKIGDGDVQFSGRGVVEVNLDFSAAGSRYDQWQ